MNDLRYPIGRFSPRKGLTPEEQKALIRQIAEAPTLLRQAVEGLNDPQLDTPYREGGWTVRQVVHHVPDSHLNSYVRFKLAMTEDHPTIRPYDEAAWARLPEARSGPIDMSLSLLDHLHTRWVLFLESMKPEDFLRTLNHPENGTMTLENMLQLYAWHGRHHTAHITTLRHRMNW